MRGLSWIPAVLGIAVAAAWLDSDSGIGRWVDLRAELEVAEGRIAGLEARLARLRVDAKALVGDEFAIERAIREDLSYARRGETVLRLRAGGHPKPWNP
ncbi:MAG: septum formation initiator family protein [Myxococcota bacterium]